MIPEDISRYYKDLKQPDLVTRLALVHQRFSTTPSLPGLAQPFRYMCHKGEINTFRGNYSRMQAREELFASRILARKHLKKLAPLFFPKIRLRFYDMVVELLLATGRSRLK